MKLKIEIDLENPEERVSSSKLADILCDLLNSAMYELEAQQFRLSATVPIKSYGNTVGKAEIVEEEL